MMYCRNCKKEQEIKEKEVIFKNGTKHLEARCDICDRYIKYLPHILPADTKLFFGKYKGKTLLEIKREDQEYLYWLYEQTWCKNSLKEKIDYILANQQ